MKPKEMRIDSLQQEHRNWMSTPTSGYRRHSVNTGKWTEIVTTWNMNGIKLFDEANGMTTTWDKVIVLKREGQYIYHLGIKIKPKVIWTPHRNN